MSSAPPPTAPGISARFTLIVEDLCRAIAARMVRNPAAGLILLLAWTRLRRMASRLATLAARVAEDRLPRRRLQVPHKRNPAHLPRKQQRLPRARFWLIRLVPEAASYASQLQHLLAEPEMAALLEAAPQAGRILRPLCRMLALPPTPALAPTPPLSKPSAKPTPRTRPMAAAASPPDPLPAARPPLDMSGRVAHSLPPPLPA